MDSINPTPNRLDCEALFQKAAGEHVASHKREVVEFYLDELSKKLNYKIDYNFLITIISDDISMLTNPDLNYHLMTFPLKGEVFSIMRIGKYIKDDLYFFPIQYLNCEIIKVKENEYIEFLPDIIYDRRILLYPIKSESPVTIMYSELPYWHFKK